MKKQIILGLILAVILGVGIAISLKNAVFVYAQSTYPLLADQTEAYFEIPTDLYRKYKNTLEEVFSQILEEKPAFGLTNGEKVGLAKVDEELVWFIKTGNEYVISSKPSIPELSYSLPVIFNKWKLERMGNNGYFNHSELNIFEENDKLLILLGKETDKRETKTLNSANFSLNSSQAIDLKAITQQNIHPFLQQIQNYPIKLVVFDGNSNNLMSNPFDNDLSYEIMIDIQKIEAEKVLVAILDEFTAKFPLVNERILPDNSFVFELQRSQEQFLEVGQNNIDLSEQSNGLITYPNGQIDYSFDSQSLVIRKNVPKKIESVDKSCFLPQSDIFGLVSGGFMQSTMWKSLEFSLGQQNLLLCITQ